jgi:hypothetical protein
MGREVVGHRFVKQEVQRSKDIYIFLIENIKMYTLISPANSARASRKCSNLTQAIRPILSKFSSMLGIDCLRACISTSPDLLRNIGILLLLVSLKYTSDCLIVKDHDVVRLNLSNVCAEACVDVLQ